MSQVDPGDVTKALVAGRTLAPSAVASQFLFMSIASIVTVLTFNILRPKNKIIYEPRTKYHVGDKGPPPISNRLFGWLPPLIRTKEPELLEKIGLDAVTYLRFLRLMRTLFTGIAILTCGALIPVNVLFNLDNVPPQKRDELTMLTIRDVTGPRLYAHIGVTYLITIFVLCVVYIFWRDMVKLRLEWFRSPEYSQSLYARTLSITHVRGKFKSDDGLRRILESIKLPYAPTSVHINRRVGDLPELVEYHNQIVREFEQVLVTYFAGRKKGRRRPYTRVGGCCGLGGRTVDAVEFYSNKLRKIEATIQQRRADLTTGRPDNYGFASLAAVPYAHHAARLLAKKHLKGTTISLAPNPKDIIWQNMTKSRSELFRKEMMGWVLLVLVCFLSLIPMFLVAALANLDAVAVTGYLPFLESWTHNSAITFRIFTGIVPPLVSGFFTFFLPRIFRWLSKYMGALTHARLDRAVIARYYAFLVISQLILFTLIGVGFNSISELVDDIGRRASWATISANLYKLPASISKTYINQTSYWLTYFPFRGFLVLFDLAQLLNLLWIYFKTRMFGRTPRDIREWTQPPEFLYAIYYSNHLFMVAVAFLFAPQAPLVALAAAVVFWMSSWVYKYQLMYVFITKVETGGRMWNIVVNRVLFSLILMQLLMCLTIGLKFKWHSLQWIATIPPIIIVLLFKFFIKHKFETRFRYFMPSGDELAKIKVHSGKGDLKGNRLENRFGHPAMHAELFTPMVHAKMIPLIGEIYKGKISDGKEGMRTHLNEYGGQDVNARVLEGVTIAYVEQNDLEYDPMLYQRDRGDPGDRFSLASSSMLSGPRSPSFMSATSSPGIHNFSGFSPSQVEAYRLGSPLSSPQTLVGQPLNLGYHHHRQSTTSSNQGRPGTSNSRVPSQVYSLYSDRSTSPTVASPIPLHPPSVMPVDSYFSLQPPQSYQSQAVPVPEIQGPEHGAGPSFNALQLYQPPGTHGVAEEQRYTQNDFPYNR